MSFRAVRLCRDFLCDVRTQQSVTYYWLGDPAALSIRSQSVVKAPLLRRRAEERKWRLFKLGVAEEDNPEPVDLASVLH